MTKKKEKLKYQKQKYALKTYILNKIHMCGLKKDINNKNNITKFFKEFQEYMKKGEGDIYSKAKAKQSKT